MSQKLKIILGSVIIAVLIFSACLYFIKPQDSISNKVTGVAFYRLNNKGDLAFKVKKDDLILEKKDEAKRLAEIVKGAYREPGIPSMAAPEILLSIKNENGKSKDYFLWCGSPWGKTSLIAAGDTNVIYSISEDDTAYMREILMGVGYFKEDKKTYTETLVFDNKIACKYDTAGIVDVSKDGRYFIISHGRNNEGKTLHVLWDNLNKKELAQVWMKINGLDDDYVSAVVPQNLKDQFIKNGELARSRPVIKPKDMSDTLDTSLGLSYSSYSLDKKRVMYFCGKTPVDLLVYNIESKKHIPVIVSSRRIDSEKRYEMRHNSWWLEDGSIFTTIMIGKQSDPYYRYECAKIIKFNDTEINKMLDNAEIYKNLLNHYGSEKSPGGIEKIVNMGTTEINNVLPFEDGFLVLVTHKYKKSEVALFYMEPGKGIIRKVSGNYPERNGVSINRANLNGKNIIFGKTSDSILNSENQSTEVSCARIEAHVSNGDSIVKSMNPEPGYDKNGFVVVEEEGKKIDSIRFYDWKSNVIRDETIKFN